jgi:hypothetical protein
MMATSPVTSPDADDSMDCEKIRKRIRPGRRADSYPHVICECAVTKQRAAGESYSSEWSARWFARVRSTLTEGCVRAVVSFIWLIGVPGITGCFDCCCELAGESRATHYLQRTFNAAERVGAFDLAQL